MLNKFYIKLCCIIISVAFLTSCNNNNNNNNINTYSVADIHGQFLQGKVAKYMDQKDKILAISILETNRTAQATTWKNNKTHYKFTVIPTETYEFNNFPCREYLMIVTIKAKTQAKHDIQYTNRGRACRQADGSWNSINIID